MTATPRELELPLGEARSGDLAARRIRHLAQVGGLDSEALGRLTRVYPSLGEIYGAPEEALSKVIGPVAAARIRWFLDAPLDQSFDPRSAPVLARAA